MPEPQYGPRVTVTRSCADCKACETESYRCQGDSGIDYYCAHPIYEKRRPIGIFGATPDWCPALTSPVDPATRGWFAALADARLAARQAGNEWLMGKLDEIRAHVAGEAVRYVRKPEADRRISRGDDFAGDAWLDTQTGETVYTVVGFDRNQQPTMIVRDGRAVSTAGVQEVPHG